MGTKTYCRAVVEVNKNLYKVTPMAIPNWINPEQDKIGIEHYFNMLGTTFPSILPELNSWGNDLFHMKMEVFAAYTLQQIQAKNELEVYKCLAFQEKHIPIINSDLKNAIEVSYCETLNSELSSDEKELLYLKMEYQLQSLFK